jgi:hypothetical protein
MNFLKFLKTARPIKFQSSLVVRLRSDVGNGGFARSAEFGNKLLRQADCQLAIFNVSDRDSLSLKKWIAAFDPFGRIFRQLPMFDLRFFDHPPDFCCRFSLS